MQRYRCRAAGCLPTTQMAAAAAAAAAAADDDDDGSDERRQPSMNLAHVHLRPAGDAAAAQRPNRCHRCRRLRLLLGAIWTWSSVSFAGLLSVVFSEPTLGDAVRCMLQKER